MLPEHENVGTVLLDIGMSLKSIGWLRTAKLLVEGFATLCSTHCTINVLEYREIPLSRDNNG
jgi:hypothetical protein